MVCRHCSKEYDESYDFCPFCSKPKLSKNDKRRIVQARRQKNESKGLIVLPLVFIALAACSLCFSSPIKWLFFVIFIIAGTISINRLKQRDRENGFIPTRENVEYCPRCKSNNLKVYRKGYDWNRGFWYRMFNIKGGHYLAGAENNRAVCHCKDCGKTWETDFDIRHL